MKKLCLLFTLAVFIIGGFWAMKDMAAQPRTYDGKGEDVLALYENPASYDVSDPDGVADIIIQEDLAMTKAVNAVTAIVFDFRGYDTMGEAFILVTAITGSVIILRSHKKGSGEQQ